MTVDVKTTKMASLSLLKREMEFLVNGAVEKPKTTFSFQEESNNGHKKGLFSEEEYGARLQEELNEIYDEQAKWKKLSGNLDKKAKQMEDKVVRLTTSAKVFQGELHQRSETLANLERKWQEKKANAQKQIEALIKERQHELDNAAHAKKTAEEADERLQEDEYDLEQVEDEYCVAVKELKKLEGLVQDLEINLQGNNSLSGNQREYMKAECQMERDHRDKCRTQVDNLKYSYEGLKKSCKNFRGRKFLFQDEHRRRITKAATLQTKIEEQQEFNAEVIENFRKQVDKVRADRDAWEEKTSILVKEVGPTREESDKLKVKARLFRWQLEEASTALKRMEAKVAVWDGDQKGKENQVTLKMTPSIADDVVQNNPGSIKSDFTLVAPRAGANAGKAFANEKAQVESWKPALSTYKSSNTSVALVAPPMAKVKYTEPKFQPTISSHGEDKNLRKLFEGLRQDMQKQKRFQLDQARKMEQQFVNLASSVEALAGWSTGRGCTNGMPDDPDMRMLLQQMNKQCMQLSKKFDGLDKEIKMRDEQHATLENRFEEKERMYFERMEFVRTEMQQQLKNQQQVFFEKMNETVLQMQQVVSSSGNRRGNTAMQDSTGSLVSLESLHPFESPRGRQVQVRFVEVPDPTMVERDELPTGIIFAPSGGLSMTSGIMMNSPLYKNMTAAFRNGPSKPSQ